MWTDLVKSAISRFPAAQAVSAGHAVDLLPVLPRVVSLQMAHFQLCGAQTHLRTTAVTALEI